MAKHWDSFLSYCRFVQCPNVAIQMYITESQNMQEINIRI